MHIVVTPDIHVHVLRRIRCLMFMSGTLSGSEPNFTKDNSTLCIALHQP